MSNFRRRTSLLAAATLTAMIAVFAVASPAQAASYGPYPAKVDIDGRGSMDPNDRIHTDTYLSGEDVYIQCQDWGMSAGGSTLWNFTVGNYWIPDAYITTGTSGRVSGVPLCSDLGIDGSPSGVGFSAGPYPAKFAIDGRGSMDPDDRVKTDAYVAGDPVYVKCQDWGMSAGGSTLWIYTTDGYWVPDAYVTTGTSGFVDGAPRCLSIGVNGTAASGGSNSGPYPVKFAIDGRGSPDPDDRIRVDAYPDGSSVYVRCQDYGVSTGGSTLWIYTTDGYWVPDAYVTTGTSGRLSGVPLCSDIGVSGGSGSGGDGQQFKIRATLNGYFEKSLNSGNVWDKYPENGYVTIMCQAYGEVNYGGSAIWDLTSDGLWIPDYYVITGSNSIVLNRCDNDGPSGGGNSYLVKTTLNGYHEKSLNSDNVWDKYPGGSYVTITCQAYGEWNYGNSAIWDYTSDGLWVPDYYISTGSTGIVMSRCDDDPPPSGGPGNPSVPSNPNTGSIPTSEVRDHIVNAAYSQLGTHEWGDNCNPYRFKESAACGQPWCSYFASWTWAQAGIDVYFPYSGTFETWGKNRGLLSSKSNVLPGDVVLYGTNYYDSNHVGVVVDVAPNGYITTIEGNYQNEVTKVGPFDPDSPSTTGHTKKNIYAVVSPVSDGSKEWSSGSGVINESTFDQFGSDVICTSVNSSGGMKYQLCLETEVSTPSSNYGAHRTTRYRGKMAIRYDRGSGDAARSAAQATLDLYVPGNGWADATCASSSIADGVQRDCYTSWLNVSGAGLTSVDAEIIVDGSKKAEMRAAGLPIVAYQQENGNYCGPAVVKSSSATMRTSTVYSQDTIADQMGTGTFGTYPSDMADGMSAHTPIAGTDYSFYDWYGYGTSGVTREIGVETIRDGLEADQPSAPLVQYAYLPWADGGDGLVRHYLMAHGYTATWNGGGEYTNWPVMTFHVWDTYTAENYVITVDDLITAGQTAAGVGEWDVIAPTG